MVNETSSGASTVGRSTSIAGAGAVVRQNVRIVNERGLTMLSCSRLVEQFSHFNGKVTLSNGAISVDGRSILEMLQLAAVAGTVLTVELIGPDAEPLMQRISLLLASGL
jgi:phosphotransferase system HPr (HPr) family protein